MLAKARAYGKATQTLQSVRVHIPSPALYAALKEKHPQKTTDKRGHRDSGGDGRAVVCAREEVLAGVRKLPLASAAGGLGLRPNHLAELLKMPDNNPERSLLSTLTKVVSLLLAGSSHTRRAPWLAGARLAPLHKPENGVRLIAVGKTLNRLVSVMSEVSRKARDFFQPHQVQIATLGGTEGVVHSMCRRYEEEGMIDEVVLLSIDFKSALNLVSRAAFLKKIKDSFAELLPWVRYCYFSEQAYL